MLVFKNVYPYFVHNVFGEDQSENAVRNYSYQSMPAANIAETNTQVFVELAVPGVSKDMVQLEVENNVLIVKAEKDPTDRSAYNKTEFDFSNFRREFRLGKDIDPESVSAKLENGILTITLDKKKQALKRVIEVK